MAGGAAGGVLCPLPQEMSGGRIWLFWWRRAASLLYIHAYACVRNISGGFAAEFFAFCIRIRHPKFLLGGAGGADFSVMMGKNKFFYGISGVVWGRVVKWCKTVV